MEDSKWIAGAVFLTYLEFAISFTSLFVILLTKVVLMSFSDEKFFLSEGETWMMITFGIVGCFFICVSVRWLQAVKEGYLPGADKSVTLRTAKIGRIINTVLFVVCISSSLCMSAKYMVQLGMSIAVAVIVVLVRGIFLLIVWKFIKKFIQKHEKSVSSHTEAQCTGNVEKDKDASCESPHVV